VLSKATAPAPPVPELAPVAKEKDDFSDVQNPQEKAMIEEALKQGVPPEKIRQLHAQRTRGMP